ncbi:PilC/PilY family type IV pilus protein [Pseudomonas sp. MIL19]|uniref:pilus assembly protein n=1 Tax=Pseudomonas sp. MIL19 TaxID=2976979 RepID=UPI0023637FCA|nr:PilC/PilY family type IV pilus protein [Pseudomonas sp. MIL19]MDD2162198.1 PilC/PilY family type IV pilus protein [Pseudomonas sp. MIL19]
MKKVLSKVFLASLLLTGLQVRAEDIDLFVGTPPDGAQLLAPNVLIVLDNTANWNQAFSNEMAALSSVVGALPPDKFNLGLMMFTETGKGNSNTDGAYVRAAIRPLTVDYKTKFQALVGSLDSNEDKSNGGKISKSMWEAYKYYSGDAPHAGNGKNKTDYAGNATGTTASNAIYALTGNALASKSGTPYNAPQALGCVKNYIIYISNGAAQDNNSDITAATNALIAEGGSATTIPISPSGSQGNVADEWARFMKKSELGVTTYTVDINKVTTGQGPGWTALLKSVANVSNGRYFDVASSGNQIADALAAIFSEIQSVDSAFASVSLPASVNTEGRYLNQIFVGLFRPDSNSFPRWVGNLKQFKVERIDGELATADANSQSAINNNTGYFNECARSFWTPTTTDSYWAFRPQGECLTVMGAAESNSPDGNVVEKGGHAYMLRSSIGRNMKTCATSACTSLADFTSSVATQTLLGAATTTERDAIINWALGQDNQDENTNSNTTEKRPSVHGDVIHSRPVAINYGTDVAPQVVVFYGGNDGQLRAINGNRSATAHGASAGSELWSFMPPEFYPHIKRLRDNTTTISFPGQTASNPTPEPKNYGMDGSVTAYREGSNTWLYAGMRRGGRALYSFNVSNPAAPSLKWKKGCPDIGNDTGCSSGMSGIGQTWSTPVLFKSAGYADSSTDADTGDTLITYKPMLVMGGGYDSCEDADPSTCSSPKGAKVYVMDADSGNLLKSFDTERGVVADVTLVRDANGLVTYGYTADLGGNVYRISMGNAEPAAWTITKIASLGCDSATSGCNANRKFMFAPSVVNEGASMRVMLGSGDREKPITAYSTSNGVDNYFFMLVDQPGNPEWLDSEQSACSANLICLDSLLGIGADTPEADEIGGNPKGWYLQLQSTEQVVTSAVTGLGTVIFSTHTPAVAVAGQCSSLGGAKAYRVSYKDASATGERYVEVIGGGLPPSPVIVQIILDDGSEATICISCGENRYDVDDPFETTSLPLQPKSRVYWNIEQ